MAFDGGRALLVGDYVTPSSGEHAGQLGPWAGLVESIGIEPTSTFMKVVFVAWGMATLTVAAFFAAGRAWAWKALLAVSVASLWYLFVGTLVNLAQIALLLLPRTRAAFQPPSGDNIQK